MEVYYKAAKNLSFTRQIFDESELTLTVQAKMLRLNISNAKKTLKNKPWLFSHETDDILI